MRIPEQAAEEILVRSEEKHETPEPAIAASSTPLPALAAEAIVSVRSTFLCIAFWAILLAAHSFSDYDLICNGK